MLTTAPTPEMIAEWKRIFAHAALTPNRKTGSEVDGYFRAKYACEWLDDADFQQMVSLTIIENEPSRSKLPPDTQPDIRSYRTGSALVAIDLNTGEFHVESENTDEMIRIHDDLFVYRGLDAEDLQNFFLVAEYVKLSKYRSEN